VKPDRVDRFDSDLNPTPRVTVDIPGPIWAPICGFLFSLTPETPVKRFFSVRVENTPF